MFYSVLPVEDRRGMCLYCAFVWVFLSCGDGDNFTEYPNKGYLILI